MRLRVAGSALLLQLSLANGTWAQGAPPPTTLGWQTFVIAQYGTRVDYPTGIFAPAGAPEKGVGERFQSKDGRAILSVYSQENTAGDTPLGYLKRNLRVPPRGLGYQRITRSFFAISQERDGLIYYSRCNFSRRTRNSTHCFDLVYPQEEKRAWDPVVTRISLSLQPKEP
ncbi:MAG: hypothetical protein ACJ8F3_20185 [Xanthobacteraceae bacterium]